MLHLTQFVSISLESVLLILKGGQIGPLAGIGRVGTIDQRAALPSS